MIGRNFQNRVRAFSALYPIPIVFSAMLVFATCCLGLAAVVVGSLGLMLVYIGAVSSISAIALVRYVTVYQSDLLRVERASVTVQWVDRNGPWNNQVCLREKA